ncbi:hypothetical protein [Bacillus sp. HMF5848]|uniref:hypothetical protein n=1 Tax=Bacillus sp. HMF5848 TaxID=2495421 RepID=UPI00163B5C4A|nr:hypothetical protein [Bacillus sp. HMF5848]
MIFNPKEDGFITTLLMETAKKLKNANENEKIEELYERVMSSHSLKQAMSIIQEYQ